MSTERVKNILIVLFSLITLVLASLLIIRESRYSLSSAQQSSIIALLEQADIFFDGRIVRNFRPMRHLAMERYDYDLDALASAFFGDKTYVLQTNEANSKVFETIDGTRGMEFSGIDNNVIFVIPGGFSDDDFVLTASSADSLVRGFLSELGLFISVEPLSVSINFRGDYVFSFFETYRGYILYNNHIRVTVSDNGITFVTYSRANTGSFIGEAASVFSGDEALMALMNHLRHQQGVVGRVNLVRMELAYLMVEERWETVGIPVYVFTVDLGRDLVFNYLFNAFTNAFINFEFIR